MTVSAVLVAPCRSATRTLVPHHLSGGSDVQTFVEMLDADRGPARGHDLEAFVESLDASDRSACGHDLEFLIQWIDGGHLA